MFSLNIPNVEELHAMGGPEFSSASGVPNVTTTRAGPMPVLQIEGQGRYYHPVEVNSIISIVLLS